MTQAEVLKELIENTHTLFTAKFVTEVNEAFNTKLEPFAYSADAPANPKGLTLNNGRSHAIGMAAFDIAPMLCRALNVKYEGKLGRGSQVQACVYALRNAGFGK